MLGGARDFFSGFEAEAFAGFAGSASAGFGAGASAGFAVSFFGVSTGFFLLFGVGGSSLTIAAGLFMLKAKLTGVSWPHFFQHERFSLRQVASSVIDKTEFQTSISLFESMYFRLKSLKFRLGNFVWKLWISDFKV